MMKHLVVAGLLVITSLATLPTLRADGMPNSNTNTGPIPPPTASTPPPSAPPPQYYAPSAPPPPQAYAYGYPPYGPPPVYIAAPPPPCYYAPPPRAYAYPPPYASFGYYNGRGHGHYGGYVGIPLPGLFLGFRFH